MSSAEPPVEPLFPDIPVGATVTGLRPLPSDPSTRSVLVDGRVVARLSESEIEQVDIAVGQPWDDPLADRVADLIHQRRARQDMMKMLSRRNLTRGEVVRRLEDQGHDADVAAGVVGVAVDDGWVDDASIADGIIERATSKRPATAEFLREKLAARLIEGVTAEDAITRALADTDPVDEALELAHIERDRSRTSDPQRVVRRIASVLARRGYDDEVIGTVIDRLGLLPEEMS